MSLVSMCTGTPLTYQQVHQSGVDLVGERCCVVCEFSHYGRSDGVRRVSSSLFLRGKLPPLVRRNLRTYVYQLLRMACLFRYVGDNFPPTSSTTY